MMRSLLAAALAAGCMVPCLRADDEEKVPLDKLPKPVVEAVKKRYPSGKLVGASKESENGKVEYEVNLESDGKKIEVTLTAEGTLTGIEIAIDVKDLPKPVAAALEAKYPGAKYKDAEQIIKVKDGMEKVSGYEVEVVTADKKTIEVVVSPEGKIESAKEEKSEKKEQPKKQ
jgi:uncharacterized membrane protein YkoI